MLKLLPICTALILLGGCSSPPIKPESDAPGTVLLKIANESKMIGASMQKIRDTVKVFRTPSFSVVQVHYPFNPFAGSGMDTGALETLESYCKGKGGIYPDETFGARNPREIGAQVTTGTRNPIRKRTFTPIRRDCVSVDSGKLIFAVFAAPSPDLVVTGVATSTYNFVILATVEPKEATDADPGREIRFAGDDLPNNFSTGTFRALSASPLK